MSKIYQGKLVDGCKIFAHYSPNLIGCFKRNGGKWDASEGSWTFSPEKAKEIFTKNFGEEPDEIVTVLVDENNFSGESSKYLVMGGYLLAIRYDRDGTVKLADGVELVAGNFAGSAGSYKYPAIGICTGVVLRLNVRKSFAIKHELKIEKNVEVNIFEKFADEVLVSELKKRGYNVTKI